MFHVERSGCERNLQRYQRSPGHRPLAQKIDLPKPVDDGKDAICNEVSTWAYIPKVPGLFALFHHRIGPERCRRTERSMKRWGE